MKTSKYLLVPVFIFLGFFVLEKVFGLESVKRLTQGDATYLYFDYKTELLDRLEEDYAKEKDTKKFLIVVGSSRLLYFDVQGFLTNYPDWKIYNFSAPVTAPAYYDFIVESILHRGVKPTLILVEADPFQFNDGTNTFERSNLAYSFDFRYILTNFSLFKRGEVSYFLARNLFMGFKYPPDLKNLTSRLGDKTNPFLLTYDMLTEYMKVNYGAGRNIIPKENWYERDFARLEATSKRTVDWLYGNYTISERQFDFLNQLSNRVNEADIPLILIRPQVSRPMQALLEEGELGKNLTEWDVKFNTFLKTKGHSYLDLTHHPDYYCNTFVDGSHMSIDCYQPMMTLVMMEYWRGSVK